MAEHGRGGLGRVYRARDRELGRDVALKELLKPSYSAEVRFFREAFITARLEHPGIVPVHEVGRWPDGTPYYAMKLVGGRPLSDLIAEAKTLAGRLGLLPHLIVVADAIAYAHDRRIIHRDLKPSNIVIGAFGETVVIDWGLAKSLDESERSAGNGPYRTTVSPDALTKTGSVLGTPAYMAPEQARGEPVDERADVYAIGVILYELCTGRIPYESIPTGAPAARSAATGLSRRRRPGNDAVIGASRSKGAPPGVPAPVHNSKARIGEASMDARADKEMVATERNASEAQYPTTVEHGPSKAATCDHSSHDAIVNSGAPSDLLAIAQKAMAPNPDGRYSTARELAEDLKRFRTGHLVGARRYSKLERFRRWMARRRVLVTAAALVILIAIGAFAAVVQQRDRARGAQARERLAREQAEARRNQLTVLQARSLLDKDPTNSVAWLKTYPADGDDIDSIRNIAADAVGRGVARHILRGHTGALFRVHFSGDGKAVASSGVDSTLRMWNVATGRSLFVAHGLAELGVFALDPNGRWLAHDSVDGIVYLRDLRSGREIRIGHHAGMIRDLSFSADGSTVVSSGSDGAIHLFNVTTQASRELRAPGMIIDRARLDPMGRKVASCGSNKRMLLWDIDAGAYRTLGSCDSSKHVGFAFSADGKRLAIGHLDGSVSVWDARRENEVLIRAQPEPSALLSLSGSGELVATADSQGNAMVWSTSHAEQRAKFQVQHPVSWVELSPSGHFLLVGTVRGGLHLYDLPNGTDWELRGHTNYIAEARFSPDERLITSASGDRTVRIWKMPAIRPRVLRGHSKAAFHPVWLAAGSIIAAEGSDGTIRLWDLKSGSHRALTGHHDAVWGLLRLPNDTLVSASWDGTVRFWDTVTAAATATVPVHKGIVRALSASPDSKFLASGGADGRVRLLATDDGRTAMLGMLDEDVYGLAFSPDGELLAAGDSGGNVRVWNMEGEVVRSIHIEGDTVYRLLFTPDGTSIVTGGKLGLVRLWNLRDRSLDRTLLRHAALIRDLVTSADGHWLVSGARDGTVQYLHLASRDRQSYLGSLAPIGTIASYDNWIAVGADDGSIRVVQLQTGSSYVLFGHSESIAGLAFSSEGALLASASFDGTVRVWPVSTLPRAAIVPSGGAAELRQWLDGLTTASTEAQTIPELDRPSERSR